jgi:hypothetical protein
MIDANKNKSDEWIRLKSYLFYYNKKVISILRVAILGNNHDSLSF